MLIQNDAYMRRGYAHAHIYAGLVGSKVNHVVLSWLAGHDSVAMFGTITDLRSSSC